MRAAVFDEYQSALQVRTVPDPVCPADGVIVQVAACGICRSDWHGWMGHDNDVHLPHVPGHELAGTVVKVGSEVNKSTAGDRVTVPFCCGCGSCPPCAQGQTHICDNYTQPGFTQWGAFAELVMIRHADVNLVRIPETVEFSTAASLGCRFATSYRAIVDQAQTQPGDTVAIYGCGGVGLSAVMIAVSMGARVAVIDLDDRRLQLAQDLGAEILINAGSMDPVAKIMTVTNGGADVSVDALGSRQTCQNSIQSLRKQGRHVQVGLMLGDDSSPSVPMGDVIGRELQLLGSHGMPATAYSAMLQQIEQGVLAPDRLIGDRVTLAEGAQLLTRMGDFPGHGVTIIEIS